MNVPKSLLALSAAAIMPLSAAQTPANDASSNAPPADGQNANLELALAQLAGMIVCERMRGNFRPLKSEGRDQQEATSGTLWIRQCNATANGKELSVTLGGQGWRWIYRQKERAGAQFEVSQYGSFDVDIAVTGSIDARYEPRDETLKIWYQPTSEPEVNFKPLSDMEVDSEGLWSSVVGGVASVFMQSPEGKAYEQFQSMGRKRFADRFSQGYTASLDFCTGRLQSGFGMSGQSGSGQGGGAGSSATEVMSGYMHRDGLIVEGPHDVEPDTFAVEVETAAPLQAELACQYEADQLADAFLENQQRPQINTLVSQRVEQSGTLQIDAREVRCPVAVVFRPAEGSPDSAFEFQYRIQSAPLMQPAQDCSQSASASPQR